MKMSHCRTIYFPSWWLPVLSWHDESIFLFYFLKNMQKYDNCTKRHIIPRLRRALRLASACVTMGNKCLRFVCLLVLTPGYATDLWIRAIDTSFWSFRPMELSCTQPIRDWHNPQRNRIRPTPNCQKYSMRRVWKLRWWPWKGLQPPGLFQDRK